MSKIIDLQQKAQEVQDSTPDYSVELTEIKKKLDFLMVATHNEGSGGELSINEDQMMGLSVFLEEISQEVEEINKGIYKLDRQ